MKTGRTWLIVTGVYALGVVLTIAVTRSQGKDGIQITSAKAPAKAPQAGGAATVKTAPAVKPKTEGDTAKVSVAKSTGNQPGSEKPGVDAKAFNEANANKPDDWAQWGGSPVRNNVPYGKNIAADWKVAMNGKTGEWDKAKSKNIKWAARLGSQSYGNPVVANGQVYVGSNNGAGYLTRYPASVDLGVLLCFSQVDGKFLWQDSNEKLPTGRVHDWPLQGVCCAPLIEGDRLWYVTNRGEIHCLDTQGFHDEDDDGLKDQLAKLFDVAKNEDPTKDKLPDMLTALKDGKISDALRAEFKTAGLELPAGAAATSTGDAEKPAFKVGFKADSGQQRNIVLRMEGPAQRLQNADGR